jgi:hypothetical protein
MSPPSRDRASYHFDGFSGFEEPNFTQVPNVVIDELAPELTEAELRVLLYIVRRTFGFHREWDYISLSQLTDGIRTREGEQLDHGTGMSRKAVSQGCARLVDKGIITVEKRRTAEGDNDINAYQLRFRERRNDGAEVVTEGNHPREQGLPGVVTESYPQKKVSQKKDQQEIDTLRNSKEQSTNLRQVERGDTRARQGVEKGRRRELPPDSIAALITDLSVEFHDSKVTRSNLTKAARLFRKSGLSEKDFYELLMKARWEAKAHNVKKRAEKVSNAFPAPPNRMPYFWGTVEKWLAEDQPGEDEAASG